MFDPELLAKVGVRSILSPRSAPILTTPDPGCNRPASEEELKARYDYSGAGKPSERLTPDASAPSGSTNSPDLGDGFEPTFAMAYMLAEDKLRVSGSADEQPAANSLSWAAIRFYPDATKHEYQTRLRDPYDWAFTTDTPKRKLFAIPGNHDWYDGLASFSALFCSAAIVSPATGRPTRGWRCHQHRSYFAIKLPHDCGSGGPTSSSPITSMTASATTSI